MRSNRSIQTTRRKADSACEGRGGTSDASYCKNVWQKHIDVFNRFAPYPITIRVVEFGPGNSIGTGLCALLSGAREYYAFDARRYNDSATNLALLDELIKLGDYDEDRVNRVRRVLNDESDETIKIDYIAPWENGAAKFPKVDFVFSQAVLEHVDNLENFYKTQALILDGGGFCSHQIDFRSHGESFEWNGHWAIKQSRWRKIRYIRSYSINREPLSIRLKLLGQNGFEIVYIKKSAGENLV